MAAAVIPTLGSPPPLHNGPQHLQFHQHQSPWTSHSVNRSTEFLSAARTAFKILQQQQHSRQQLVREGGGGGNIPNDTQQLLPEWMANLNPMELKLYQPSSSAFYYGEKNHDDVDNELSLIQDSQTLLQLLDSHLAELHTLVRRRGHTNDPTLEIQSLMEKFQESAREVKDVCDSLRLAGTRPYYNSYNGGTRSASSSSSQRRKHYEILSQQLESLAKERTDQLKLELETRSQVLRDQSHRRKLLACGGGVGGPAAANSISSGSNAMSASLGTRRMQPVTRLPAQNTVTLNAASQFQSPLFTATAGGNAATMNATASSNNNAYAGYAGSSTTATPSVSTASNTSRGGQGGYAGYGGTLSAPSSFATGMRQRKQQNSHPSPYQMQSQQQSTQSKSHIQIDSGNEDNDYNEKYNKSSTSMTQQISMRREQRATHMRAQQARLAEKSIAELGVMFHKMSSLIVQQGETLERIEDDVESAGLDIDAGHDELVKVYGMTKGNRGLILKVFGVLIFLIIFMKLY